ncbi:hypothetical protein KQX54_008541 [Cotesia glomerata]|uniref:Uncharacterized protein n=1 Tax=Cotesia glomerata TaxID=32391 RepID=A0AAV7IKL9_COTGL|nr:hypothetical protein KQX54_008541 [Cotesia glomerata]
MFSSLSEVTITGPDWAGYFLMGSNQKLERMGSRIGIYALDECEEEEEGPESRGFWMEDIHVWRCAHTNQTIPR